VEELYGIRYQSGSLSLVNVGNGFHCLRSFFFFLDLEEMGSTITATSSGRLEINLFLYACFYL
jgi:hypothetical protein